MRCEFTKHSQSFVKNTRCGILREQWKIPSDFGKTTANLYFHPRFYFTHKNKTKNATTILFFIGFVHNSVGADTRKIPQNEHKPILSA